MKPVEYKPCEYAPCTKQIKRQKSDSSVQWSKKRFCSPGCNVKHQNELRTGREANLHAAFSFLKTVTDQWVQPCAA